MKDFNGEMFVIFCALLISGYALALASSDSSSYNYSANINCKSKPMDPQYNGGLVNNSKFDSDLNDWDVYGNASITRKSDAGNFYLVAYNRSQANDGFSHSFDLQKGYLYTFSAWLQVSEGDETLVGYLDPLGNDSYIHVGSVIAKSGCWSLLKGGFQAYEDIKVKFFIKCPNTKLEVWIDNVSLKKFTKEEWRGHQQKSINKIRKRKVRIHVKNENGDAVEGANVTLTQTRTLFTIGGGTPASILGSKGYQDYFKARFTAATPHNEMKWYYNENFKGQENYTVADAMLSFFASNGISVRGHNILWDSRNSTPYWAQELPPREMLHATVKRTASVVSRYSGRVIGWDVMNENLHNEFLESLLGANASAMYYQIVRAMDPHTPLFLNEYNTLEYPRDLKVIPSRYIHKIKEIRSFPGNENLMLRIGLEGHFTLRPNVSYIRAAFDLLGATGIPIWLTELDFLRGPDQANQLEAVMREAFAHPAMEGIIVWGGWKPDSCGDACLSYKSFEGLPPGCSQMCLCDNRFKNLAAGDVVDKLLNEWRTRTKGVTSKHGTFEERVFHGAYNLTCSHPSLPNALHTTFNVTKDHDSFELTITLK